MEEAERIAREEHGSIKLAVISGESLTIPSTLFGFFQKRYPFRRRHEGLLSQVGIRVGRTLHEQITVMRVSTATTSLSLKDARDVSALILVVIPVLGEAVGGDPMGL